IVYDEKVIFHRRRRNFESVDDEGRTEQCQDYRYDERLKILAYSRFLVRNFNHSQILSSISLIAARYRSARACVRSGSPVAKTRSNASRAAACSAAFFVRPMPRARVSPSTTTSTVKSF